MIAIRQRGQGKTNIYTILRLANSASQESQDLRTKNTQRKDPKKKTKISNFEDSKAPTPIKTVTVITPEFKVTHPDLWQAGCSGVAEFTLVVGQGFTMTKTRMLHGGGRGVTPSR